MEDSICRDFISLTSWFKDNVDFNILSHITDSRVNNRDNNSMKALELVERACIALRHLKTNKYGLDDDDELYDEPVIVPRPKKKVNNPIYILPKDPDALVI